ncbi:MAG: hypothetical protein ISS16_08555 [Ignavibacteria bacterium]|nr:hypothetical protein [Ignavibacteria bacterium]
MKKNKAKHLDENFIEWSLKHHLKFYSSDFFPKSFEFDAIKCNWDEVKDMIKKIDISEYSPKSPKTMLALKPNGNFRIVHNLQPIDSIIYTSLIYEICRKIEKYRISERRKIACSYRIKPTSDGSFFRKNDNGWNDFKDKTEKYCDKFKDGFVLVADIADFYNQIYTHKIKNIIAEAGEGDLDNEAEIIDYFLLDLNKGISKGIPVGPAASIILSEAIMGDIDNKILKYSSNYVRYADDIRIFAKKRDQLEFILHELSDYIYKVHRLIFAGDKTKIYDINTFTERYFMKEEKEEKLNIMSSLEDEAKEELESRLDEGNPYTNEYEFNNVEYDNILLEVYKSKEFKILTDAYMKIIRENVQLEYPDYVTLRHVIKKCGYYRIKKPIKFILNNFEFFKPIIREVILYFNKVLNEKTVNNNINYFNEIFKKDFYKNYPYINMWMSFLFRNKNFKKIKLRTDYIETFYDKTFYAALKNDKTFIKGLKTEIDVQKTRDKHAIIFCSNILSKDERNHFLRSIEKSNDILDRSIAKYVKSFN